MQMKLGCKLSGDCIVDQKCRKLCKKCRLKKCFTRGMKKECILNEEERESRRHQIEINRKLRANGVKDINSDNLITSTLSDVSNATTIDYSNDNTVDNTIRDDEISECITQMANIDPNNIVVDVNETHEGLFVPQNTLTDNTITNQIQDICIGNNNNSMVIDIFSTNNTINKLIQINCFNDFEQKRLEELYGLSYLNNYHNIDPTYDEPSGHVFNCQLDWSADYIMERSAKEFDKDLTENVNKIQCLKAFKSLCLNDQIALIKYGCIEFKLLKTYMFYKPDDECWRSFKL
ncbi:unnamed protein product, partial [Medioppia subpectinata]